MAGLEVDRKGDVDDALHGAGDRSETNAVAGRGDRPCKTLLIHFVGPPFTEVLLGLCLCLVGCDVTHHHEVGHIGLPDLGIVFHQVRPGDGLDGGLVGALPIRVLQSVGHGARKAARNRVGVGGAAGKVAQGLLALLLDFLLRKGGVHEHVRHDAEQGLAVLDQTAAVHAESRGAETGADAVYGFVDLGLGAGGGSGAHQGSRHGGVSGAGSLEDGIHIQGQAVADARQFVVLYDNEGQAICQLVHRIVAQDDFRSGSRFGCRGAVDLREQRARNGDCDGNQEGSNAVHCAFSFMK